MHASKRCALIIYIYNTYGCYIFTDIWTNKPKSLILNSPSGTTNWDVTDIAVYHTNTSNELTALPAILHHNCVPYYSTSRPDVKCLPSLFKHSTCDSLITNTGYNTCQNFTLSSSMGVNCGIKPHIFAYNSRSYNRVRNRARRRGERRITNMSAVRTWARLSSNSSRLVVPVYGKFTKKFYWRIVYRWLTKRPIKRQHTYHIHEHSDYRRNDISLPSQWEFNPNNTPINDTVRCQKMK